MSLALLAQAQIELRRLSVAGSRFAKDDFRLQKLIAPLLKAGEKVPVFKAIGSALETLAAADKKTSASALIRASGMVSAVLATQGRHAVEGELTTVTGEEQAVTPQTNGSARRLRPVLEALTQTGSGRLECIQDAFKDGLFADFRLMRLAINHLEDPYPPVADFVAEKILPSFGPVVLPKLTAEFDKKGGARNARALKAIHAIEGDAAFELLADALEDGAADVRVAAVQCLQHIEQAHSLLLAHAKDKHKDVRHAVVSALGNRAGEDVIAVLMETVHGTDYYSANQAIRSNTSVELTEALVAAVPELMTAAQKAKKEVSKKGAKKVDKCYEQFHRFSMVIGLLGNRKHDLARQALADILEQWESLSEDVQLNLLEAIHHGGSDASKDVVVAQAEQYKGRARPYAIGMLFQRATPAEAFDSISPLCAKGKRGREAVIKAIPYEADWDKRWLDFALANEIETMIMRTARKGHSACLEWLRKKHKNTTVTEDTYLAKLIELEVDDAVDLFVQRIKSKSLRSSWYRYHTFRLARKFDPQYLDTFEQLATELPDSETLAFLDALEPLRTAAAAK